MDVQGAVDRRDLGERIAIVINRVNSATVTTASRSRSEQRLIGSLTVRSQRRGLYPCRKELVAAGIERRLAAAVGDVRQVDAGLDSRRLDSGLWSSAHA